MGCVGEVGFDEEIWSWKFGGIQASVDAVMRLLVISELEASSSKML